MLKTWDEIFTYLSKQENCSIHGQGFAVLDLHKFLSNSKELISLHKRHLRASNVYCRSLKGTLIKVYIAYDKGLTDVVNKSYQKKFSIYSS